MFRVLKFHAIDRATEGKGSGGPRSPRKMKGVHGQNNSRGSILRCKHFIIWVNLLIPQVNMFTWSYSITNQRYYIPFKITAKPDQASKHSISSIHR